MKNFVQPGDTLDLTAPSGGVTSGSVYKIGSIICVAAHDAAEGEPFAARVTGVFDVTAEGAGSGQDWSEGTLIYWDDANTRFTVTATNNTKAGVAVAAKASAATAGRLKLIPTI